MVLVKLQIILIIYSKSATLAGVADCWREDAFVGKAVIWENVFSTVLFGEPKTALPQRPLCKRPELSFFLPCFYLFFGNCVHLNSVCF